ARAAHAQNCTQYIVLSRQNLTRHRHHDRHHHERCPSTATVSSAVVRPTGPTQGAVPACSARYDSDMRAGVGVTDAQWAAFLRDRPHLREANFWVPNPRPTWRVADQGSAWLFKTRWPANQIVGAGCVSGYARLRVSEAWEFFGEGNARVLNGSATPSRVWVLSPILEGLRFLEHRLQAVDVG